MIVECAEIKSADAICGTDISINSNGKISGLGGDGYFEKVIELGTEESSGNFRGDKGVFNDGAGDVFAGGRLNGDPFSEVGTAIRGDEESIFFGDFVVASAISTAGFGAVGGAQRVRVGAGISRSAYRCVCRLFVSQTSSAGKYRGNVGGSWIVGRRGIGSIIMATFFQIVLVGWACGSETQ